MKFFVFNACLLALKSLFQNSLFEFKMLFNMTFFRREWIHNLDRDSISQVCQVYNIFLNFTPITRRGCHYKVNVRTYIEVDVVLLCQALCCSSQDNYVTLTLKIPVIQQQHSSNKGICIISSLWLLFCFQNWFLLGCVCMHVNVCYICVKVPTEARRGFQTCT